MTAPAKFLPEDSFLFTTKNLYGLTGKITNGNIAKGMLLIFPANNLNLRIDSIEDVRSLNGMDLIGLLFKIECEEDLSFLDGLSNT